MINIKFDAKEVEKLSPDWIRTTIKTEGIFEGTYECTPEKEKIELRESLGQKYLDWNWLNTLKQ